MTVLGLTFQAQPRTGAVYLTDAHKSDTVFARTPKELEHGLQELATREVGRNSRNVTQALRESAAVFAQALMNARNVVDDWKNESEVDEIARAVSQQIDDFHTFCKLRSEHAYDEHEDPSFVG